MTSQRLRGVVCLTRAQPQSWEVGTVAQLQTVDGVELLGYVHVPQPEVTMSPLWRALRRVLFRSHSLRPGTFPASLPLLTQIPEGVDFVLQFGPDLSPLSPVLGGEGTGVRGSSLRKSDLCKSADPLTPIPSPPEYRGRGEKERNPRLGTWVFRPSDGGLAAHFGAEVTSGFLVRLEDNGVLYQGHLKTMRHSPSRNADQLCNEMARWPADLCRHVLAGGPGGAGCLGSFLTPEGSQRLAGGGPVGPPPDPGGGNTCTPIRNTADQRSGDHSALAPGEVLPDHPRLISPTPPGSVTAFPFAVMEAATALPADVNPTNGQALGFATRTLWNFTANFLDTLFLDAEWNIGIVEQPISRFLDPAFQPQVAWLPGPAPGRFAADSFIVDWQGRRFLYFEDLDFRSYKGRIWAVELKGTQPIGKPVTIFDPPHHLSYPYLLEHQGGLYMIPESSAVREVALYRAVELPARWEKVAVLLKDVPAVDSSVFFHEGRWWLLATQPDYLGDANAHLYLWFAPDLLGPWQPHPGNPVKVDVRSARPAGPPFVHEGRLYRPAQDCSQTYGGRVVLLEITTLSPTAFSEQPLRILNPIAGSRYPGGLHTLSGWNSVTVLDGKRTIFNRHAFAHAVRRKFGRLFHKLFRRRGQVDASESHP